MKTSVLARIEKEMSVKYLAFFQYEKVKREKVNTLIDEYAEKATGLTKRHKAFKALMADFKNKISEIYKDDFKVQPCG